MRLWGQDLIRKAHHRALILNMLDLTDHAFCVYGEEVDDVRCL